MDMLAAKLIALCALIVLTITFSVIPYFLVLRGSRSLVSDRRRNKAIAILNCFGGGVFLGTLLLHLMTEGADEFELYKSKANWKTEFPFFNIFVAGGFFLVAFIEFFIHSHLHHTNAHHAQVPPAEDLSQERGNIFEGQYGAVGSHRRGVESRKGCPTLIQKDSHVCAHHNDADKFLQERHEHQNCEPVSADYVIVDPSSGPSITDRILKRNQEQQNGEVEDVNTDNVRGSECVPGISGESAGFPDGLRAFLLLFALSFHTLFDGLAVGLQNTASEIWQVFAAISIHKSIIAFCLGLELFKCHTHAPWRAFAWICFFSIMSPIGIGLGIGLTSDKVNELARLLASSILQGVAAGTFLYVTFLEILSLYIGHNCHRKFVHIFAALVGFVFMAGVKLVDHD